LLTLPSLLPIFVAILPPHTEKGNLKHLVWFILIGLVAGWLAGKIRKGEDFGVLGDIVVGQLGGFLFHMLGTSPGGGLIGSLIVALVGAIVLLYLVRLFKKTS
jgi:uncharacterized membrane protein YeaQ/YmgE (transglycosylase-associated protein family)